MRLIFIAVLLIGMFSACSPDQIESAYPTYQEAVDDDFFSHGWIPEAAVSESMVNIFCLTDVPSNTCIFGYQADQADVEILRTKMQFTDDFVELPGTIKQPNWWIEILANAQNYVLQDGEETIFIAIQNEGNTVLGWRN